MTGGRGLAAVAYGVITLLCLAWTAWTVTGLLAQLDPPGEPVRVRLTECHREGGGRGPTYTVCSGRRVDAPTRTVELAHEDGQVGDTVPAVRGPWGGYTPVETGFVASATAILVPVLPLTATVLMGAVTVSQVRPRRARGDGR